MNSTRAHPFAPLTHCPMCGYDLSGLPDQHRCPECAFAYDRRMVVIRQAKAYAWFALFFFGGGALIVGPLTLMRPGNTWNSVAVCPFMLLIAWRAARTIFLGQRNRVIVSPEGVMTIDINQAMQTYPWAVIMFARYQRMGGGLLLIGYDGHTVGTVEYDFLGSTPRVRLAIEVINAYRAHASIGDARPFDTA